MAGITLAQVRGLGDFATTNNWDVEFLTLPQGLGAISQGINLRCISTDIPSKSGSSVSVQIRGLPPVKQPGIYTPGGTIELSIVETVDNFVSQVILDWREMCFQTGTGNARLKKDVEAVVRLTRKDRTNKPIWQYTLIGVFLENASLGGLSADAGAIQGSLTFSYDDYEEGPIK